MVSTLLLAQRLTDDLGVLVRGGLVRADGAEGATVFTNPVLGAIVALPSTHGLRSGLFFGSAFPVGKGGGSHAPQRFARAQGRGSQARSNLDGALFAVNDVAMLWGAGSAFVAQGVTAQLELTVIELTRVRMGPSVGDLSRTNLTGGFHLGYFWQPALSSGLELRHQRWLSTPRAVNKDASLRDTTTLALGPRAHFKIGAASWVRPAIALVLPLDDPLRRNHHRMLQLDVPVSF